MISDRNRAIGSFLIACEKLDSGVHGGKQKLQKIVGKNVFYKSPDGKKWFYNMEAIRAMTIPELKKLKADIKAA